VKSRDGAQLVSRLVDCAATLEFVLEDFVRRFALQTRKSPTKTHVRLANGQRVTSSTICDVTLELARHEFQRNFYVLPALRATHLVLGLPWLDKEQASLHFGTTMDGTTLLKPILRRPECLQMSLTKIQKLMRKTRRITGRKAEFNVIDVTPATYQPTDQPTEFHIGEKLTAEQCENFRSLLYDDFRELLQPLTIHLV
jgi:hypothetical protein